MARRMDSNGGGDQSKVRVFCAEYDGSTNGLQDLLRAMTASMNRPVQVVLPALAAPAKEGSKAKPKVEDVQSEIDFDAPIDVIADSDQQEGETRGTRTVSNGGEKRGKPRMPKLIPDLDMNVPTPSFKDFCDAKGPKDSFDWYVLVAYWLREHKSMAEIGIDHIYTASRFVDGLTLPADVGQPFRDGRRRSLFGKGSKAGMATLTIPGENKVKAMGK